MGTLRRIVGVLVLWGLLGLPVVAHAESADPPACAYRDVTATSPSYADWATTLLDPIYRLPKGYRPPDLRRTGLAGGGFVRAFVLPDLRALMGAAARAGVPLRIVSAYRSEASQVSTFAYWVSASGRVIALRVSARPGHSEHQLGTTLDFTTLHGPDPWRIAFGQTAAGRWLAANATRFGFVLSYPADSSPEITCYKYEPWHFRYVGREQAAAMAESGLAPRTWLWRTLWPPEPISEPTSAGVPPVGPDGLPTADPLPPTPDALAP